MKKRSLAFIVFAFTSTILCKAQEPERVITFELGDFQITTLSEGQRKGDKNILIDVSDEIYKKHTENGDYTIATNAFLIRTPDKKILVDTGYGFHLQENLQSLGVSADEIDVILLTHMHGDHIGGVLKDGKVMFPKAELYISQSEHDYWTNIDIIQNTPENRRKGFTQAGAVIDAYKSKLHLFTPSEIYAETENLMDGIKGISAYGHTPGHTAYMIESKGSQMLIWGDLTHAISIQIPHSEIAVTYDTDPKRAIASRKQILEYLVKENIPTAGMHVPFPAIGDIKKGTGDAAYEFTPFCLCLGI